MGKKKQRKGAPDIDDDFPGAAEASADADPAIKDAPVAAPKKQDKKKKAKKVGLLVICSAAHNHWQCHCLSRLHLYRSGQSQGLRLGV